MTRLRGFQTDVKEGCYTAWDNGATCVMPVIPTGGGKTVLMGDIARNHGGYGCAIAHRSELNMQLSVALAKEGVRHDIIAPKAIIKGIVTAHMEEVGRSFYDTRSNWKVASIDTILRRDLPRNWLDRVDMIFQDEGHHVLRDNKWGRGFEMFGNKNKMGLFPTAFPERADGKGLGSKYAGLVDALVVGPDMRWMIDNGFLTGYKVVMAQPSDFNMDGVDISPVTGEFNHDQAVRRIKASTKIIGDAVKTYQEHCPGKIGITFAIDVEEATKMADAFNKAGIPAKVVHAGTPDIERRATMRDLANRKLLMVVNVDLFGEGVDVPALEVVIMARATASGCLFTQQFGRALRLMISKILHAAWDTYSPAQRLKLIAQSDKPYAMIIDMVGNIITHFGPPDWRKEPWTLEGKVKKNNDKIPLRACDNPECAQPYERKYPACPYCGKAPDPPADRSRPEYVDGDLHLYTEEMLAKLFGNIQRIDGPCLLPRDARPEVLGAIRKRHAERQGMQQELRQTMSLVMPPNIDERINNRSFFLTYGVDTLAAQSLGAPEAKALKEKIVDTIKK